MTQLQLSAGRQERRIDPRLPFIEPRVTFANASFRTQIRRNIDVFASFGYRNGISRAVTAWAGISMQLGKGRSAQASANTGSGMPLSANAGFYRHDTEQQRLGYGLEAQTGASTRVAGTLSYRSAYGRAETQVERVAGDTGLRLNARGTLLVAGGTVFARNQTGGSYALVRTGRVGGVTVLRENRTAGVTAGNGLLLVENIAPQVPLTFDIDPEKLPADALARATHRRVLIPRKAIGLVALDVVRFRPRQVRVTGPDGAGLPVGTGLIARPSGELVMVGFDGLVDFNADGGDIRLERQFEGGALCVFDMRLLPAAASDQTPSLSCRIELPSEIVARDPAPRKGAGRPGAGRRR
jgi:outer membrane usher protein